MHTFTTLNKDKVSALIRGATHRVVYVAPSISQTVAESVVQFLTTHPDVQIEVVVDSDPDVFRFGYGEFSGIELLTLKGISLRKAAGLRIGLLIVDDRAWVFSPSPLMVEPERTEAQPNAIAVCTEQAEQLLRSVAPKLAESSVPASVAPADTKQLSLDPTSLPVADRQSIVGAEHEAQLPLVPKEQVTSEMPSPEIGEEPLEKGDIQAIKASLEERPPQKFDLTRLVNVYHGYVQFVRLSLTGCQLSRRTISLPRDLIAIARNENMQDRLKATFRLVDGKSKAKAKDVEKRLANLRKKNIKSLGERLGSVMLRQRKEAFVNEVIDIQKAVQKFSDNVKQQLEGELTKCRNTLVKELSPGVVRNPPASLLAGITTRKPTKEQAMKYIGVELDKVIPKADSLIKEMKLDCDFKDVTYEMLNDVEFQDSLRKQFPYVDWPKPFEEYQAAKVANGAPEQ
jgi:hypothetical protein